MIESVKTHPNIGSYTKLIWKKFGKVWHWFEIPNNNSFDYHRLH